MALRKVPLTALLAVFFSSCSKPGDKGAAPAPELKLDTLLQAPVAKLEAASALKGKVAVLEFWATWCDPCVEEIPHLNSLVDKFSGKPVVFISITDETKDKVEAFLKDHPMKGWVAVDAKPAFDSFGVHGRPHTVIIDSRGRLAGTTYPAFLRPEDLDGVLAGKPLARSEGMDDDGGIMETAGEGDVLFKAVVSAGKEGKMSFSSSEDSFRGRGLTAEVLLANAYGVNEGRVTIEPPLKGRYDVDVRVPRGQEAKLSSAFRDAAVSALSLSLAREKKSVDVAVFSKVAGKAPLKESAARPGKRVFSTGPGRITATSMSLAELCDALEQWLGRPVVDETGLKERYDFELTWDAAKPDSLAAALETQLGLKSSQAKRPVAMLVFKALPLPAEAEEAK
ncbi:MAG: TIGR03435 family protein [Elusimicrobia bacterium]|nr:TIGR03435 family protein [Elusimicrobiota bacterium]